MEIHPGTFVSHSGAEAWAPDPDVPGTETEFWVLS